MSTTPVRKLRYPVSTAAPNVPQDIQNLATDVETALNAGGAIVCTSTTRPTSPTQGLLIYETDTQTRRWYDGANWIAVAQGGYLGSTMPNGGSYTGNSFGTVAAALTVTIPAGIQAGSRIKVHGFATVSTPTGVGAGIQVISTTGTPQSAQRAINLGAISGDLGVVLYDTDLTAGSRTYNLQFRTTVSGQTITYYAPELSAEIV